MMSGYRRVNYYELCRLCTSSDGTKMHIFREEGRRRQLTYKIQTCLPLQVQEEDSLPKIICSSCVERLESFYEFREACVNAEAMLESYFTSLKYSDDLTREGKVSVYVKDEAPKKKEESSASVATKLKMSLPGGPSNGSENTNLAGLQPTAIQILTDNDGNHITQYKVQLQGNLSSLLPSMTSGSQTTTNTLPISLTLPALHPMKQNNQVHQLTQITNKSRSDETTQTNRDSQQHINTVTSSTNTNLAPPPPPLVAALTITQNNNDILQRLGVNTTKESSAVTRFADLLKMKNISIIDANAFEPVTQIQRTPTTTQQPQQQVRIDTTRQVLHQQTPTSNSNLTIVDQSMLPTRGRKPDDKIKKLKMEENFIKHEHKTNEEDDEVGLHGLEEDMDEVGAPEDMEDDDDQQHHVIQTDDMLMMYACVICNKTFKKKEHLFQHRKSHSGERPFVCTTCSKAFSRKEHLIRHNVSHTGQKMYTCDVCMKSFSRKDNLHKHKKTHGINGPHVCDVCGKSFVVKHYYVMHKQTHENEHDLSQVNGGGGTTVKNITSTASSTHPLPYKCDLCNKSFSSKQYLDSHRLRHRNKSKHNKQLSGDGENVVVTSEPTVLTNFTPSNINLTTLTSTGLTTINPNALLTPNLLHSGSANMVQIGNTSYLCTANVNPDFIEQYRRLHSS